MASFHQTIVIGHLGRDPETRFLPSGDPVCNFSVAVTENWKDKSGERREKTTWYRVSMFGRIAEVAGQYLKKGSQVQIVGRMEERKWEQDGVERTSWDLRADQMTMLGSASGNSNSGSGSGSSGGSRQQQSAPAQRSAPRADDNYDDDISF